MVAGEEVARMDHNLDFSVKERRCAGCEIATLGLASWSTMTSPKVISGNSKFLILGWRSRGRPRRYLRGVVDGVSVGRGWQNWRDTDSHRHRRFDFR